MNEITFFEVRCVLFFGVRRFGRITGGAPNTLKTRYAQKHTMDTYARGECADVCVCVCTRDCVDVLVRRGAHGRSTEDAKRRRDLTRPRAVENWRYEAFDVAFVVVESGVAQTSSE